MRAKRSPAAVLAGRGFKQLKYEAIRRWWWDGQWEWGKRKEIENFRKVSGRLKVIEPAGISKRGFPRVLCLCACGAAKVYLKRDIMQGRATRCTRDCMRDRRIRRPHKGDQEILNNKGEVIKRGPPHWDPVLKMGVFTTGRK
jgi:hypothetical protein